jgi:opacity protein-like surface antigen
VGTTGWEIHPSLRLEVQTGFTRNSVRAISSGGALSGSTSATTTMLVGRWLWPSGLPVRPFGAVGVGRAWVSQNLIADGGTLSDSSASSWAYQASVGALVPLTEGLDLDLAYRYFGSQRGIFLDNNFLLYHSGFASHAALVGLTWRIR